MKFTQETDYAFRIVQTFAKADSDEYLTAAEMSEREKIPYRFLLRVLRKLKRAGIVRSRQGIDGGYRLGRPAGDITLLDVIEAVEGEIQINRCLKDMSFCNGGFASECQVHRTLMAVQENLLRDLKRRTFADLTGAESIRLSS